jgi:sulfhydrogenase subunit gamma (sulfur reductase)
MENIYLSRPAVIVDIRQETNDTKTFYLAFKDKKYQEKFLYKPGQFIEVSLYGYGEAPFGMATSPTRKDCFITTIRSVGTLTKELHKLQVGNEVGIRGPFGNNFPFEEVKKKNILFMGGGIGLPPLRSLIHYMLDKRKDYYNITVLYGARTPKDLVYKEELKEWEKSKDLKLLVTVDAADETWKGNVGVVGSLLKQVNLDVLNTYAFVCGPPIMIRFAIQDLLKLNFPEENIITTLERYMKCGVGKCGHCAIGYKYVCVDGPVFNYKQIKKLPEKA